MPFDVEGALGAVFPSVTTVWDADRVLLYHLGIGAAAEGIDERALRFVWEDALCVLPTFAVVPGSDAAVHASAHAALAVDPARVLQHSHEVRVSRPLPVQATVTSEATIEQVHDTGRSAVVTIATRTVDETGVLLATNRLVLLVRAAGGFGGAPPPSIGSVAPPHGRTERLHCPTAPNQGALYRLSGDRTPLHIDPVTARAAGFAAPPLAGLCTLGIIGRRVVESVFAGDPTRVAGVRGTFSGAVYPGETLLVDVWPEGDGLAYEAVVAERDVVAVRHGAIDVA